MAWLSMNEATTFRWSFEEDVAHCAAAGIPAIGVWRQKLSDCGEQKAVDLLARHQLKVSHLFWAGGFTGSDGRSFRESVQDGAEAVKTAAELPTGTLIVYSGARAGHTHNHARRLFRDALKELAPAAAEQNVVLGIEPMHPGCAGNWTFLHTIDDTMALLDAVECPNVQLVFDIYHLGHDPSILERVPGIVDRVALVQLADAPKPPEGEQNRCLIGRGTIPVREIVQALKAAGYDGYYDVELLGEEIEATDYESLLAHAKEAYGQLVG